jgi:hypothetical protein
VWARDQYKDLDRLQQVYSCDVLVTLVREQELRDLRIEDLFDEVKKRGMQSLYAAPLQLASTHPFTRGFSMTIWCGDRPGIFRSRTNGSPSPLTA